MNIINKYINSYQSHHSIIDIGRALKVGNILNETRSSLLSHRNDYTYKERIATKCIVTIDQTLKYFKDTSKKH